MKKKVLLGMSGGVDSSVSAILLKKDYDVYGVTMKLWEDESKEVENGCCSLSAVADAKRVCDGLGIPHYTLNFKKEFQESVINDFICEYKNCRTPNPCIECNKYLKFGVMYNKAKELGIEYIATGHYAKIEYDEKYKSYVLKKADNRVKDQSYFLYSIPKELLEKIVFPLSEFKDKSEIREIAKKHELKVANKPDSEDICFIPDGNYKKFLEKNSELKQNEGDIVKTNGEVVGRHKGLYNYTIGQRKGINVSYRAPLYVIGFNKDKNQLIVGEKAQKYIKGVLINNINWLINIEIEKRTVMVKTRYSSEEVEAEIDCIDGKSIKVNFKELQPRVALGQSVVFYDNDIVIGGGKVISNNI